jgi:uncharacterized protein (TIRG00374 family)
MMFFQCLRWWVLIRAFTKNLSFFRSLAYHFSSSFYSLIIPNSLTQEIIRSVFATKQTGSIISWSSTWISKIIGIITSLAFSLYGLYFLGNIGIPKSVLNLMLLLLLLFILISTLSFSKSITSRFRFIIKKIVPLKAYSWLEKFREGVYQYKCKKRWILLSALFTLAMQFTFISGVSILIYGITGKSYFLECMAYMPIIEMICMIQPLTPNGIGIREGLVALMFKHLELTGEQLAVYIIISNLTILIKLLGIIPVLFGIKLQTKSTNEQSIKTEK